MKTSLLMKTSTTSRLAGILAAAFLAASPCVFAQTYWTGNSSTNLSTGANWSTGAVPVAGAIMTFNGNQTGSLGLTFTANTTVLGGLAITSSQNSSLTITTATANRRISLAGDTPATFQMDSAAGAFTMGGSGTGFLLVLGSGTADKTYAFTNNSSNAATFASNVTWATGSGSRALMTFGGSGDINIAGTLGSVTLNAQSNSTITKTGAGTLTLSGINYFNGVTSSTTINEGTLAISGAGALGNGTYAGNIANAGALVIGTSANQALNGVITGAGSFEQTGTGTTTLTNTASTFTGNVSVTGGILALNGDVNVANPTATVIGDTTVARTLTVGSGATLRFASSDAMGNAASTPLIAIINNGGTIDNNGAQFNPLGALTLNGGTLTGTGGVIPQYQMYTFNGPVTVTDNATISGSGANSGYHLSPTGSTTFDVAGGKTLTASGTLINRWGDLLDAGLTKTGNGTMVISGNNSYSGQTDIQNGIVRIQDSNALGTGGFSGTALSIVRSGATLEVDGSLALTEHIQVYGDGVGGNGAIRAISGNTTIGEWVALMAADSTVGVDTGATLTMNRGFYEGAAGRSLTKVGGGTLTMAFENNYTGITTVNGGILELAVEGSNVLAPLKGDLVVNAGTARVTAGNAIWGYSVANLKQATLNAGGTLTTVAGIATTLGNTTLNGGTLASEGAGDPIWGNWAFNQGAGTVTIAVTDNSTISASRVLVNVGGGATDINVSADKSLNVSGELSSVTYAAHGFNKTGTGMLVLSGNNTYGGLTDITSGVVRITDSNALGTGGFSEPTMTTIQNGATLEIAGSLSIGEYIQVRGAGVGGSGAIRATSGSTSMNMHVALMADTTIGVDSGATLNFSAGTLFNVGGFTKVGAGTLILSNTNAYSGNTIVSAGTLLVNNTSGSGTGSGTVTVNSGGTLGGGGIITGLVTINAGGTLSPGNSPGTLTQGATTFNGGGNYNWQIVDAVSLGGIDRINLTAGSALTIGSTSGTPFNINLWSLSSIAPDVNGNVGNFINTNNYTWTLVATDQLITGFSADKFTVNVAATNGTGGFSNGLGGGAFAVALADGGTDLVLTFTAVPEPATWGLLAFGLTLAALRRRRRG